jgi:hypothetical protein
VMRVNSLREGGARARQRVGAPPLEGLHERPDKRFELMALNGQTARMTR